MFFCRNLSILASFDGSRGSWIIASSATRRTFFLSLKSRHSTSAEAGRRLAQFHAVSHCYERRTFEGWPYNLYAMVHGRTPASPQRVVDQFTGTGHVLAHALLPTEVELKKHPVRLTFRP